MVAAACEAAGIEKWAVSPNLFVDRSGVFRRAETRLALAGDLLFRDKLAYIVQPVGHRLHVWEIRHHSTPSEVDGFCALVETTARTYLDGRRVRGMSFAWQPIKETGSRRFAPRGRYYQEVKLELKAPDYTQEESDASRLLVSQPSRTFLLRLAQVGKVRSTDSAADTQQVPLHDLLSHGMLRREFLILCRKDNRTICSIETPAELESALGTALTCTVCGRPFKDELIQEIHAITDFGKKLLSGSRWMTVWITDLLIASGLPKAAIGWNPEASGEELDIMTDALGPRVFFELKDREFGLGDSYPFAYRVSRYGGTFGVVVTTERVADEAKKFFQEQSGSLAAQIQTVEGLQSIETGIASLVDQFSRNGVMLLLRELSEPLALDPTPIIRAWMDTASRSTPTSPLLLTGPAEVQILEGS
jgi:hypothetical protein